MRVLVLGGTRFLSRCVAEMGVRAGHDVVCLARGHGGEVPAGARLVRADRARGRAAYLELRGTFDEVVDVTSDPSMARDALDALADDAAHWTYVSSCSVYSSQDEVNADEDAPVLDALESGVTLSPHNYGHAKVATEEACRQRVGDRLHVSRPGLIGGPGDTSDRTGYWPGRFARAPHDSVLVPNAPTNAAQLIDVVDLARWILLGAQRALVGTFHAVGEETSFDSFIALCQRVADHRGALTAVDEDFLDAHGVQSWMGPDSLPLWIPSGRGFGGFARRSRTRAVDAGLVTRPLASTLSDLLIDERQRGLDRPRGAGLSEATERRILLEWATHRTATSS